MSTSTDRLNVSRLRLQASMDQIEKHLGEVVKGATVAEIEQACDIAQAIGMGRETNEDASPRVAHLLSLGALAGIGRAQESLCTSRWSIDRFVDRHGWLGLVQLVPFFIAVCLLFAMLWPLVLGLVGVEALATISRRRLLLLSLQGLATIAWVGTVMGLAVWAVTK